MKKPITDRAEVSVDFPDKAYYGSFGQHSSYAVRADEHGLHIDLDRGTGEKRHVGFHIHYFLLADILDAAGPCKWEPTSWPRRSRQAPDVANK
jgi:hypothetical protein